MRPWGRFLFILAAYSIALLHTAVPHHHLQASSGEVILAHRGCVLPHGQGGLLQRVFSTDLGVGHLETFKKNADTPIDFSTRFVTIVPVIPVITLVVLQSGIGPEFFASGIEQLKRQRLLLSIISFRGPPV